ncbi:hypothetical protein HPB47_023761 [Ixodes persulcatus]|uniref:Uncharacterized protein n=1 Tax=Ixodes persulcatus TaxID=34615 RepID=A0AC60R2R2_IXOPE|nr:hypothetical protein HPB47_023761 [Ixodes persulcatus]
MPGTEPSRLGLAGRAGGWVVEQRTECSPVKARPSSAKVLVRPCQEPNPAVWSPLAEWLRAALRQLFFVIDYVHNVKYIRNNWRNQKNDRLCFYFPEFEEPTGEHMLQVSFETTRVDYNLICEQVLRYGHSV